MSFNIPDYDTCKFNKICDKNCSECPYWNMCVSAQNIVNNEDIEIFSTLWFKNVCNMSKSIFGIFEKIF